VLIRAIRGFFQRTQLFSCQHCLEEDVGSNERRFCVRIRSMQPKKEVDPAALAATLAQLGVPYLRAGTTAAPLPLDPPQLIAALAQHPSPRVREAMIPLFLRHPAFATHVPAVAAALAVDAGETVRHFYTAAVYLQRLWRGQLEMVLGPFPLLPDYFAQIEWGLPAPDEHFGEAGLRALAQRFQEQSGDNWLATYESAIALFLRQQRLLAYG
jgi:hypothetical protein